MRDAATVPAWVRLRWASLEYLMVPRGIVVRYLCYSLASAFAMFSLWSLLWVVSSFSMAFSECVDGYELFAEHPRCRQPLIAGLLAVAGLLIAFLAIIIGRRIGQ